MGWSDRAFYRIVTWVGFGLVVAAAVVILMSLCGCESVKTARVLDLSGAPDAEMLRASVMDCRTGSGYVGSVTRVVEGSGPVVQWPAPGVIFADEAGMYVISVSTPLRVK